MWLVPMRFQIYLGPCQTLLLPPSGFNNEWLRPQSVNELSWKVEESIKTAIKVWKVRITKQTTQKVSALTKNSSIRITNCLWEDWMRFSFRLLRREQELLVGCLGNSRMIQLFNGDETKPTETNVSLYNKPLINSLSLVSHIYIITTIYLCCHTHFLANFRHTERGFRPQTTSY